MSRCSRLSKSPHKPFVLRRKEKVLPECDSSDPKKASKID